MLRRLCTSFLDALAIRVARATINHETHPISVLRRRAAVQAADFIEEHGANALLSNDRLALLKHAFAHVSIDGLVMEFGVHRGESIRVLASLTQGQVHGFDSFEGLPTDGSASVWVKGQFDRGGNLPVVPANVSLHKGWFDATVKPFLENHDGPAAFVHIDCDLYQSTKTVLDELKPRIEAGTILLFDDWFNFPGWRQHEVKAFDEFIADTGFAYTFIGFSRQQAAIKIC